MAKYRRYKNWGTEGDVCFVTTTCLDFPPLFASDSRKDFVAERLINDHKFYAADLHAFVIMPENLHWICKVPKDKTISWFVSRFKSLTAKRLIAELTTEEWGRMSAKSGLNGRSVWQDSFRSIVLSDDAMLETRTNYIHENPVRRGLIESPYYRWSSWWFHEHGVWQDDFGMPFDLDILRGSVRDSPS